jgi:DNA-directed RNA polymerase subunit beta'
MRPNKNIKEPNDFNALSIKVSSPDRIKEWSYGEVTKPETINYRTQRSEKSGLFDEKIFGPDRDYECYCGKYRGIRYKGIVCEKCGVEITRSIVRRERMGHITLATPVCHIWFLRSMPSRIGLILGMSGADLEKVIYFAGYVVTKVFPAEKERVLKELDAEYKTKVKTAHDEKTKEMLKELLLNTKREIEGIREGLVLDEILYHKYSVKYGVLFEAGIGAEAIYNILKTVDIRKLVASVEAELVDANAAEREKLGKRLSVLKAMIHAGVRSEWMFLTEIPVIPPALRPMVALDGGRYATSDVNDLYRRVINRNNRLRKLKDINAPEVILRNEKRILQEAVDALIDNSIRHGSNSAGALSQAQKRPLKSLADNLKGKRGLLRGNLLGKRVDYSGRSVIVVGPTLKLHQCGLPKHMALELFRPFVISKLLEKELAYNIRGAGKLIDEGVSEVWAILEDVIKDKYVLLNRAPTLHRLGIQAFQPVLIEGNAIQVHPLVCTAFNADFDGDQMAVHVPLSAEAQLEAREIMASDKNILKPGNGDPTVSAKLLDIILGLYWVTTIVSGEVGEGKVFVDPESAILTQTYGGVSIRAKIKVLMPAGQKKFAGLEGQLVETSVGRLLFNLALPADYRFINYEVDKKQMGKIVDDMMNRYGIESLPAILDKIKSFGFQNATRSGVTWGIDDVRIPDQKQLIIDRAQKRSDEVLSQYNEGLLSDDEKRRINIEIWHGAKNELEKVMPDSLDRHGPVHDMVKSGARGTVANITQMAGMKGLIQNTAGDTIEFPIISSMKEGLTPIEYFITTHGSRKGLTDTALNTAKAGYLTRRLFDVAHDVIISELDCGSDKGTVVVKDTSLGMDVVLSKSIRGRSLSHDVLVSGKVLFKKNHLLSKDDALKIEEAGITSVEVFSPLSCKTLHGICAKCYGIDLGKGRLVDIGEAVGTVAAQAIGEPGTQLTMRTFHAGGTASVGGDITQGLPRVEEVFEKRNPKNPAVISEVDGMVSEIRETGKEKIIVVIPNVGEKASKSSPKKTEAIEYSANYKRMPLVAVGDQVRRGQIITDGSASIDEVFKYAGKEAAENYVISEVSRLYELQGESVSRKHIEVIVRQMFSRRRVKHSGGTNLSVGDIVEEYQLSFANAVAKENDLEMAKVESVVMGITEVSLSRRSFLSAASFQHTSRVLITSAIRGSTDHLVGLKENVIIGRLIPAGTGFKGSPKSDLVEKLQATMPPPAEPFEKNR